MSLLDFPPFTLPDRLLETYAIPHRRESTLAAAVAVAGLLEQSAAAAGAELGASFTTPWAASARARLDAVGTQELP